MNVRASRRILRRSNDSPIAIADFGRVVSTFSVRRYMVGHLVCWMVGYFVGWLVGLIVGFMLVWLTIWLVGRLVDIFLWLV